MSNDKKDPDILRDFLAEFTRYIGEQAQRGKLPADQVPAMLATVRDMRRINEAQNALP